MRSVLKARNDKADKENIEGGLRCFPAIAPQSFYPPAEGPLCKSERPFFIRRVCCVTGERARPLPSNHFELPSTRKTNSASNSSSFIPSSAFYSLVCWISRNSSLIGRCSHTRFGGCAPSGPVSLGTMQRCCLGPLICSLPPHEPVRALLETLFWRVLRSEQQSRDT